jgi:hypothetical protein
MGIQMSDKKREPRAKQPSLWRVMPAAVWQRWRIDFRNLSDLAAKPAGGDIERSLLVASGATFLTLVGVLGSAWGAVTDSEFLLRQVMVDFLPWVGLSFLFGIVAGYSRLIGAGDEVGRVGWVIFVALSTMLLVFGGFLFVMEVREVTHLQLDILLSTPTPQAPSPTP